MESRGRTSRGRGRPALSTGAAVTRDEIVRRALELAGTEGFPALTMQRLARELGVTARALYNHVRSRQEVIDSVAALMMQELPAPKLDPGSWRDSLRLAYREAREAYRRYPRAILISLDETLTPGEVDPNRLLLAEHMLRFFVDIGLTLEQATSAREAFLIDVFGFALTIDYGYDRSPEPVRRAIAQPVPAPWLDAHPQIAAPLSREAAAATPPTSDRMFDNFVELRIRGIESLIEQRDPRP
jgi:AcrR family transcriptional regulator